MSEYRSRPSTDRIEDMLHRIDIQPRPALAERMASMPWAAKASQTGEETISEVGVNRRWRLAAVAGAAVVVGISLFAVPPVRTLAQDLLRYFVAAPSDEQREPITVEITLPGGGGPQNEGYSLPELVASVDAQTPEEASRRTGFAVLAPSLIPEDFDRVGIYAAEGQPLAAVKYVDGTETPPWPDELVIFQRDRSREVDQVSALALEQAAMAYGMGFPISQCPSSLPLGSRITFRMDPEQAAQTVDEVDIGAGAQIVAVEIAGVDAEYVVGWWVPSPDNPCMDENGTFNYTRVWDPTYPIHQLRWEVSGITYSLQYYSDGPDDGTPALTMQQLIGVAESMFK